MPSTLTRAPAGHRPVGTVSPVGVVGWGPALLALLLLAVVASLALGARDIALGQVWAALVDPVAGDNDHLAWHGENAQPFDAARSDCRASTGKSQHSDAFRDCMAAKGWTRS